MAAKSNELLLRLKGAQDDALHLRGEAESMAGKLLGLQQTVQAQGVTILDGMAHDLYTSVVRDGGALWLDWGDPEWQAFSGPTPGTVLRQVRLGRRIDAEPLSGEAPTPDLIAPVTLLDGRGALVTLSDVTTQQTARSVLQSLILRIAIGMPSEVQFTLIDPIGLGAAFPFKSAIGRVRPTGRTVADELGEVLDDIRRINERVVGHADRFLDLSADQRAGEAFEIVVVADFPKAYMRDPRTVEHLVRIANSGPRAGQGNRVKEVRDKPVMC